MSDLVQRAAKVMVNQVARHRHGDDGLSDTGYWTQDMDRALTIAAALAAAGLLADPTTSRTDDEQAVIDAAKVLTNIRVYNTHFYGALDVLIAAVDRLAAPGPSSIDTPDNRTGQTVINAAIAVREKWGPPKFEWHDETLLHLFAVVDRLLPRRLTTWDVEDNRPVSSALEASPVAGDSRAWRCDMSHAPDFARAYHLNDDDSDIDLDLKLRWLRMNTNDPEPEPPSDATSAASAVDYRRNKRTEGTKQ